MAETRTPRLGLPQWSAGTDSPSRADFNEAFAALEQLGALDLQGTVAARPAPGVRGRYYYATDQGQLSRDDGTAWQPMTSDEGSDQLSSAPLSDHPPGLSHSLATQNTGYPTAGALLTVQQQPGAGFQLLGSTNFNGADGFLVRWWDEPAGQWGTWRSLARQTGGEWTFFAAAANFGYASGLAAMREGPLILIRGRVAMSGDIQGAGMTMATLPAGVRPVSTRHLTIVRSGGVTCEIEVHNNGHIILVPMAVGNANYQFAVAFPE